MKAGIIKAASRRNPLIRSEVPTPPDPPPVDPPGELPDLMAVTYADVGEVNPHNVEREMPFVQSVAVPLGVDVPKGVYGVRIGDVQLAAQARSVKHRPNGTASILRVEGVWPAELTTDQTISLTDLPPAVTSVLDVPLSFATSTDLEVKQEGVTVLRITPSASTAKISGSKPSQLKGSNTSPSYVPSTSFHEWHIARSGSLTDVQARWQSIAVEEDTPILRAYIARGRGIANNWYEFQLRLVVYKYRPWIRWEYTTFKHFPMNTPGNPSNPSSMDAIASERLTITPDQPFSTSQVKSTSATTITVEADPYGEVTGSLTGDLTDEKLNAIRCDGDTPLSAAVRDLMGSGPSALRATAANLIIDLWSQHTNEVLDLRGTGKAGEVQASSDDYNASTRGTGRTWEGFFALQDSLPLAQQYAERDDIWFMTPQAMEDSECFGPLKAAAGSTFAAWFKRVYAFERAQELAVERHKHYGYAQYGLYPSVIPDKVDTSTDQYVAREPMHSGRYGQTKDSHLLSGDLVCALLLSNRKKLLRALRTNLLCADINGHHEMLFGSQYMGSARNGVHRRYRDPWTGRSDDQQYYYPEAHYYSYWVGGPRRMLERGQKMAETFEWRSDLPYSQGPWAAALKYQHTNSPADLTKLNNLLAESISRANNSYSPPSAIRNTPAAMWWGSFRYGHNTLPFLRELWLATGDGSVLDAAATAYRVTNWSQTTNSSGATVWRQGFTSYGQHTTPYHMLAILLLQGYTASQVSQNAINSMNFWIGNYIQAGTMRNHNASLPGGDPEDYTWNQVLSYWNGQMESRPGYQKAFGPYIASWYATQ